LLQAQRHKWVAAKLNGCRYCKVTSKGNTMRRGGGVNKKDKERERERVRKVH